MADYFFGKSGSKVFLVAEIGKNFIQTKAPKPWREYLANAQRLARLAKRAGADAVKFQTHSLEDEQLKVNVVSPHFAGSDRYSWVKRNEEATPPEFWRSLKKYCDQIGLVFFSAPMSRGAAEKLNSLGVKLWKVGSGDILDFVMLDYLAKTGKPIILSSGMSTLAEIDKAVDFLKRRKAPIALLHCVSRYPCPAEDLNLRTIEFFKQRYGPPIGFSDHSLGYNSAVAAINLGAVIIEKHFSLSRGLWGADHKVSLTPAEFKKMTSAIRRHKIVELADYGKKKKFMQPDEAKFRRFFRKALVAGRNIPAGTVLTAKMIYAMRPKKFAGGLPSEEYLNVLGRKTIKALKKYDSINWRVLESSPGAKHKIVDN